MSTAKIALVTGANKGLGLETARQLAGLGYRVLVGARDERAGQAAVAAIGANAEFVAVDMVKPEGFSALRDWIEERYGRLDVLVNNAGVGLDKGWKSSEVPLKLVRDSFEVHVFGLVELTQALLPLVRKSEAGRIVNLSSILGSITLNADPATDFGDWRSYGYAASKAAVNMFTAILAYELRETPIKVNSAHPGWVKTDLGGPEAPLELEEGAKTTVWLATLPEDGPTGGFFHGQERLPW